MSITAAVVVGYVVLLVVVAWCGAKGIRIPVLTPFSRWCSRMGGKSTNAWIEKRRRARRARQFLPLADQLDAAGMPEQAEQVRRLVR